jgi:2-dehydro-3-deoxygluconokinase
MTPGGVVVFGDLMLRLDPHGFERIVQAGGFVARYTGAEANAGVSLAAFGHDVTVVSRVPAHEVGDACLNYLRRFGLSTDHVARGGERLGILFVESGAAQRASKVVYDRTGTAFATSSSADYDWPTIVAGRAWLHFSGTAPALGREVADALDVGLREAKRQGLMVSCDLNYRAKLWTPAEAREGMERLIPYVDVLIGNEEDADKVFGIRASDTDVANGTLSIEGYDQVLRDLVRRFHLKLAATTLRESVSASENGWGALVHDGGRSYASRRYRITPIVDRVGAGDSFSGALIHGMLSGWPYERVVEFAAAASCLKHSIPGDFNIVSEREVEALAAGDASGRVQR